MIQFIGILCAVWLFTSDQNEPIEFIKRGFNVSEGSNPKVWYLRIIQGMINCCLCSGFWVGLCVYQDFWLACITSISCEAFYKVVKKLGNHFLEV